jgi:hypothetical protein
MFLPKPPNILAKKCINGVKGNRRKKRDVSWNKRKTIADIWWRVFSFFIVPLQAKERTTNK